MRIVNKTANGAWYRQETVPSPSLPHKSLWFDLDLPHERLPVNSNGAVIDSLSTIPASLPNPLVSYLQLRNKHAHDINSVSHTSFLRITCLDRSYRHPSEFCSSLPGSPYTSIKTNDLRWQTYVEISRVRTYLHSII